MPCQHYKEALIEAAVNGSEPQGELRAHLDACAACRAAFEQEQALFASIDAGLQVVANSEVPASLLPQVRARLDQEDASERRGFRPWIFAAASVVLAIAIFSFARPPYSKSHNQAKHIPPIPVSHTPVTTAGNQNSTASAEIASSAVNNSHARSHSTLFRPVASSQPEVLVPPDEREALARFVDTLQGRGDVAVALVTPALQTKGEPANLEPLQIKELEIKTLEERETELSGGAKLKQ